FPLDDRFGNKLTRGFELFAQTIEYVLVVVLVFGILGVSVMAGTAGKVGCHAIFVARHGAVRNTIAVLIKITAEFLTGFGPFLQLSGVQSFAPVKRFLV